MLATCVSVANAKVIPLADSKSQASQEATRWEELSREVQALGALPPLGEASGKKSRRLALVIGNDDYAGLPPLAKAVGDSRSIAEALHSLGFSVTSLENVARNDFDDALEQFYASLEPGDIVMFFYAGHGVQSGESNFLLPVDMPKLKPGENPRLDRNAINAREIVAQLTSRGAELAFVVLDACRDDPFPHNEVRGATRMSGLTRMEPGQGAFIIYSAGTGQTALDRLAPDDTDANSVFTRKFMPILTTPGMPIVEIAKRTQVEVKALAEKARHLQAPAYYDEVVGQYWLQRPQSKLYGLTIGVDEYAGVRRLRGAVNDARLIASALRGIGAQEVVEILDRDARPAYIDYVWRSLVDKAAPGDTIVFAYAGGSFRAVADGGSRDEADGLDEYLMLADGDWEMLKTGTVVDERYTGALRDNLVTEWMELAAAKNLNVVFLVDGCHGGGMLDREFANISFISASAEDEVALEFNIDGSVHGAMSVAFAKAIAGGADLNGDGFVSQEELFKVLRAEVFERVKFRQTPEFYPPVAEAGRALPLLTLRRPEPTR